MSSVDLSPLYDFVAAINVSLSEQQALSLSRFYDIVSEKGKSLNLTAIKDKFSLCRAILPTLFPQRVFFPAVPKYAMSARVPVSLPYPLQ